jgi:hypothetical protein
MATRTDVSPAMQCVVDISTAAKRAATDSKGTVFGTKCSILAMAADMVLGDMTMADFLDVTIAEVEAIKK